jgi:hypothetical protein
MRPMTVPTKDFQEYLRQRIRLDSTDTSLTPSARRAKAEALTEAAVYFVQTWQLMAVRDDPAKTHRQATAEEIRCRVACASEGIMLDDLVSRLEDRGHDPETVHTHLLENDPWLGAMEQWGVTLEEARAIAAYFNEDDLFDPGQG